MSMPDMGDVIANAFSRPVFYFSKVFSCTFFPFFIKPNDLPPISFCFIDGLSHFVPISLPSTDVFPIPPVVHYWKKRCYPEAKAWLTKYKAHKELFLEITPEFHKDNNLTLVVE